MRPRSTGAVTVSSPVGAAYSPEAAHSASVTSARIRLQAATYELPASVRTSLWLDRLNSFVRRCDSRSETLRLTVARGAWRRRAAADRLPASTTVKKIDIASRRSIADSFHNLERQLSVLVHSRTFERSYLKRQLVFRMTKRVKQGSTAMLMLDRRMLLRSGSAAVGATALAPAALARAPQPGKQAQPGFYRFKLNAIEITVVSDGTLAFPAETLWGDRAEDARGLLTSRFHTPRPVGLEINTILVNTGDKLLLIDAGCGVDKFQKTTGRLIGNLAAAGYAPGDIDMVLLTHAYFDHLWGISDAKNASLLF